MSSPNPPSIPPLPQSLCYTSVFKINLQVYFESSVSDKDTRRLHRPYMRTTAYAVAGLALFERLFASHGHSNK